MARLSDDLTAFFIDKIRKEFNFPLEGRIEVLADTDHYKASEDESIFLQAKDKAPKMAEVYWDGEWIIDFAIDLELPIVEALFWQGFYKAYSEKRISLVKGTAKTNQEDVDIYDLIKANKKSLANRDQTPMKAQTNLDKESDKLLEEILADKKKEPHGPTLTA